MERIVVIEPPTDGVAVVRMTHDAKRNALSIAMRDQLSDAVDTLAGDDAVRCIVLTGDGTVFSAGFDLGEFATAAPDHVRRLWASIDIASVITCAGCTSRCRSASHQSTGTTTC